MDGQRKAILGLSLILLGSLSAIAATSQSAEEDPAAPTAERKTLTVAVVSSNSTFADPDANIQHFEQLVQEAVSKGARLVCFPELALISYDCHLKEALQVAEEIPGPSTQKLADIARRHKAYLSVGMAEKDGQQYYIAQALVGPQGYMGKYRKHHPTRPERASGISAGKEFPVFDVEGFKLGINICADGRHHDTIEALKRKGVDVIHHPHGNFYDPDGEGMGFGKNAEEWTRGKTVYFVPRATFSRAYILINNSAGDTPRSNGLNRFTSGALVIDPLGQVIARTQQNDRQEKMVIATLKKPLSQIIPPFEIERLERNGYEKK